jgi:hypothetical protein
MRKSEKLLRLTIFLLIIIPTAGAAESVHLLGFVERLCEDQPMCFEFRTEEVYSGEAKEFSRVYYNKHSQIYDAENYEVTPAQSNIVRGSYLRIMIVPVPDGFFADFIWVGD